MTKNTTHIETKTEHTINGSPVVHTFMVLNHEWECDGEGWVTEDGRVWTTDHQSPYETNTS